MKFLYPNKTKYRSNVQSQLGTEVILCALIENNLKKQFVHYTFQTDSSETEQSATPRKQFTELYNT
jgi:hypothetical protein